MKKLHRDRLLVYFCFCCLLFFPITSAQAASVRTSFTGTVTVDNDGDNPFGLFNGDAISGTAIYDDAELSDIPYPGEQLYLDDFTNWNFRFTLGTFTFTQNDVNDPTYTSFWFVENKLDGIEFYLENIDIGNYLDLLIESFDGGLRLFVEDSDTGDPIYLEAQWDFENATPPRPIAIPGMLLLLQLD